MTLFAEQVAPALRHASAKQFSEEYPDRHFVSPAAEGMH
jgi:hypothetical protein